MTSCCSRLSCFFVFFCVCQSFVATVHCCQFLVHVQTFSSYRDCLFIHFLINMSCISFHLCMLFPQPMFMFMFLFFSLSLLWQKLLCYLHLLCMLSLKGHIDFYKLEKQKWPSNGILLRVNGKKKNFSILTHQAARLTINSVTNVELQIKKRDTIN